MSAEWSICVPWHPANLKYSQGPLLCNQLTQQVSDYTGLEPSWEINKQYLQCSCYRSIFCISEWSICVIYWGLIYREQDCGSRAWIMKPNSQRKVREWVDTFRHVLRQSCVYMENIYRCESVHPCAGPTSSVLVLLPNRGGCCWGRKEKTSKFLPLGRKMYFTE